MKKLRNAPSRRELEAICAQQEHITKMQAAIIAHFMSERGEELTLTAAQLEVAPSDRLAFFIKQAEKEVTIKLAPVELPFESPIIVPASAG